MTTTVHPSPDAVIAQPRIVWRLERGIKNMAHRMVDSGRDRSLAITNHGLDSPAHLRAVRAQERQARALDRLVSALGQLAGGS